MYWVYVLENPQGRFYVGSTQDLDERFLQHNSAHKDGSKYTHKHGPWQLVWSEKQPTRASAVQRERAIKRMKSAQWICRELLKRLSESRLVGGLNPSALASGAPWQESRLESTGV